MSQQQPRANTALLFFLAATAYGCAIGQRHTYTYEAPATSPTAEGTVVLFAVATSGPTSSPGRSRRTGSASSATGEGSRTRWDFTARVFDATGEVAASDRLNGNETLEAAVRGSIRAAKMQTPPFFDRLIHELVIANPRIWPALAATASPAAGERAPKCTVDQILKMKEAG